MICANVWSDRITKINIRAKITFDRFQSRANIPWWRHQMETFSALLALCAGNSPVTGEVPSQRPVTRSFDVFFNPRLNKRLSKQSRHWWFETPLRSLWRHLNAVSEMGPNGLQISNRFTHIAIVICFYLTLSGMSKGHITWQLCCLSLCKILQRHLKHLITVERKFQ